MSDMSAETIGRGRDASGINRRTVMKGAAWSVPVIMVATAAPAIAGPSQDIVSLEGIAFQCKHNSGPPEGQRYHIEFLFQNNGNVNATFQVTSVVITPQAGTPVYFTGTVPTAVLGPVAAAPGPGNTYLVVLDSDPGTSASNGSVTIQWQWSSGAQTGSASATFPHNDSGLPPCKNNPDKSPCPYDN